MPASDAILGGTFQERSAFFFAELKKIYPLRYEGGLTFVFLSFQGFFTADAKSCNGPDVQPFNIYLLSAFFTYSKRSIAQTIDCFIDFGHQFSFPVPDAEKVDVFCF